MTDIALSSSRPRIDWTFNPWGLGAVLLQGLIAVWWAAGINARVAALEMTTHTAADTPAVVARLDERSKSQTESLGRIEARLDALEHRQ